MINPKIIIVRKKLDKIDEKLLVLIKERTKLVGQILSYKKRKNEIIDKKRINVILKKIRLKSIKMKIDPLITKKIWIAMIKSFIDYEYRNFDK
jgi:chorismate mutase|tara:strand:- start:223 stop:501 length:279 start_codon:yes stop_codon:yes gene_type:complete